MDTICIKVANYTMDTIIMKDTVTIKINAIKQEKVNTAIVAKITTIIEEDRVSSPIGALPIGISFGKFQSTNLYLSADVLHPL